jgi:hypothetical protein
MSPKRQLKMEVIIAPQSARSIRKDADRTAKTTPQKDRTAKETPPHDRTAKDTSQKDGTKKKNSILKLPTKE